MNTESQKANDQYLQGKNFFYLGLSFRWRTLERKILSDMLAAKKAGARVFLYTFRDSVLAQKAQSAGIECIFHYGIVATKIIKWHKLKVVTRLFKKHSIDLVHCYDIKIMWPLSYFLKSKPLVPLVLTLTDELDNFYRGFWYRPLNRRLDQVMISNEEMFENVWGNLDIPPIKVNHVGLGVQESELPDNREAPFFKYSADRFYLGTSLSGLEKSTQFLDPVLHALKILAQNKVAGKEITFVLGSEKNWRECVITEEIRRKVKDWGLEDYVAFMGPCHVPDLQKDLDLWLGLKKWDAIEDYSLSSLLNGTPCLLPRTATTMELVQSFPQVATLYRSDDSRSLRKACEETLVKLDSYKESVSHYKDDLQLSYSEAHYSEKIGKIYHKLLKRRQRLMQSKLTKL